jgi:hypothetical protein
MNCGICGNELSNDERSRASISAPICDACVRAYFANKPAEELMRELLSTPGFREAAETLCADAAIHGPVVLHFKYGKFYRLEKPLE